MSALSCPHFSFMFRNIDSKIFLTVIWLRILNRLTVLNWWCKDKFDGLNVPVIFILFAKFFAYLIITPVRIHSFSSIDTLDRKNGRQNLYLYNTCSFRNKWITLTLPCRKFMLLAFRDASKGLRNLRKNGHPFASHTEKKYVFHPYLFV
jgi:hypothetical protein